MCFLEKNDENNKQRYNPQNPEVALCFQLHDMLSIVYGAANLGRKNEVLNPVALSLFENSLELLRQHIEIYQQSHHSTVRT